jgi:hypothetical protein
MLNELPVYFDDRFKEVDEPFEKFDERVEELV